jgi:hypothetical protein
MRRRTACRLIVGFLLGGVLGCGRSPSEGKPVNIPPNRFPGGREAQKKEEKKKPAPEAP